MMYDDFPLADTGHSPGHGIFLFVSFFFFSRQQMPFTNGIPACSIHMPFKNNWAKVSSFQQHLPVFNGHTIQAVKISIVSIRLDCLVSSIFHMEKKYILRCSLWGEKP